MKKTYNYRAIGVLSGDKRSGFRCLICGKEIKKTLHYKYVHPEIYEQVSRIVQIRN